METASLQITLPCTKFIFSIFFTMCYHYLHYLRRFLMTLMKLIKKNEDIMKFAVSDTPFFVAKDATLKIFSNI